MSMLLNQEADALSKWVLDFPDQAAFATFLGGTNVVQLATFSSNLQPMLVIAYHFHNWVEANPQGFMAIVNAARAEFPNHPSLPTLSTAATRLGPIIENRLNAGPPWTAAHVDGRPVIDRSQLRTALQLLAAGNGPPVFMVNGLSGSGRTHSYYLIDHVAKAFSINAHRIRLAEYSVEDQTISRVFCRLVDLLELAGATEPTQTGATPETVATRYASEISDAIALKRAGSRVWLIFDSVDLPLRPELKRFFCNLAQMRLENALGDCVLFYLGAGPDFGVDDRWSLAEFETLTPFQPSEIEATARAINRMGATPIPEPQLSQRVQELQGLMIPSDPYSFDAVSRRMSTLRRDVQA
jgi:hypothetical protein